jgi:hypothetical protein
LKDGTIGAMTATYSWHGPYESAVLETDWSKLEERIQVAEWEMKARQHVLSAEERKALANAMQALSVLRGDLAAWRKSKA